MFQQFLLQFLLSGSDQMGRHFVSVWASGSHAPVTSSPVVLLWTRRYWTLHSGKTPQQLLFWSCCDPVISHYSLALHTVSHILLHFIFPACNIYLLLNILPIKRCHCNNIMNVNYFTCQWFECVYIVSMYDAACKKNKAVCIITP